MNVFNVYGAMPPKYPQLMNYWTVTLACFLVMVAGKGAEKFTLYSQITACRSEMAAAIQAAEKK